MRALWVDAGNDPDYVKAKEHGITALYFALDDPRVRASYLTSVQHKGFAVGVYVASSWLAFQGDGTTFAEKVSEMVKIVTGSPTTPATFPKVQLDMEQHDSEFIVDCLERWRELRPKQDTSWTMEPFQAGWMSNELVATVIAKKVRVVPQYYFGDMSPAAADRCVLTLIARGFPPALITGFYDAAALPGRWDGFAFTQGRLP